MIRINLSISAFGPDAIQALELQDEIQRLMERCGLSGEIKGQNFEQFASLFGNYSNKKDDDKWGDKNNDDNWGNKNDHDKWGSKNNDDNWGSKKDDDKCDNDNWSNNKDHDKWGSKYDDKK